MLADSIARRYARALYDVVDDAQRPSVVAELEGFADALEGSDELRQLLYNPAFSESERRACLDAVFAKAQLSKPTQRLVELLVERGRSRIVGAVAGALRKLSDEQLGAATAEVTSSHELSEQALGQLRQTLEQVTGKKIEVRAGVDPALIGGVSVKLGSIVIDGSLRGRLARMRSDLGTR